MSAKFQKAAFSRCEVIAYLVKFGWSSTTGTSFSSIFFDLFFTVIYYCYKIGLRIFKRLRSAVEKLLQFWWILVGFLPQVRVLAWFFGSLFQCHLLLQRNRPTSFWKAVFSCCEVIAVLVDFGWILLQVWVLAQFLYSLFQCHLLLRQNRPTSFWKAVFSCCEVIAVLVDFGWILLQVQVSAQFFWSLFQCHLLLLQNRPTNFRKTAFTCCDVMANLVKFDWILPQVWILAQFLCSHFSHFWKCFHIWILFIFLNL